jgi:hypothetical protein
MAGSSAEEPEADQDDADLPHKSPPYIVHYCRRYLPAIAVL